jgi:hypothetical protein
MGNRSLVLALAAAAMLVIAAPAAAHMPGINFGAQGGAHSSNLGIGGAGHPWNGPNVPRRQGGGGSPRGGGATSGHHK